MSTPAVQFRLSNVVAAVKLKDTPTIPSQITQVFASFEQWFTSGGAPRQLAEIEKAHGVQLSTVSDSLYIQIPYASLGAEHQNLSEAECVLLSNDLMKRYHGAGIGTIITCRDGAGLSVMLKPVSE